MINLTALKKDECCRQFSFSNSNKRKCENNTFWNVKGNWVSISRYFMRKEQEWTYKLVSTILKWIFFCNNRWEYFICKPNQCFDNTTCKLQQSWYGKSTSSVIMNYIIRYAMRICQFNDNQNVQLSSAPPIISHYFIIKAGAYPWNSQNHHDHSFSVNYPPASLEKHIPSPENRLSIRW